MIKAWSHKLLMTFFVYNYVVLKYSVFIFLDRKQEPTVLTFSIAMCGDNRYVDDLRILTATELYLNSEFYSKRPSFISLISNIQKFSVADAILAISVSHNVLDSNKSKGELVQNEAINMCTSFEWAGFLCVLGLASICSSSVQCYYKSSGSILKYNLMFSQLIEPRLFNPLSSEKLICCFPTALMSLQFLLCIITMFH